MIVFADKLVTLNLTLLDYIVHQNFEVRFFWQPPVIQASIHLL